MAEQTAKTKGEYSAIVSFNRQIKPRYHRLGLEFSGEGAKAFGQARPGQFAQFDLSTIGLPAAETIDEDLRDAAKRDVLLRRPFSFAKIESRKSKVHVDILYCVQGPATLRMTALKHGDTVNVIGPLGNGYKAPEGKKLAILVTGGMGAPPLQHMAQVLTADFGEMDVLAFGGAKTVRDLPFETRPDQILKELGFFLREFAEYGIQSMVATDDGGAGFEGTVTDCLAEWLKKEHPPAGEMIIYACGPEAMLAAVAKLAREKNIDCQVSMERLMACGIGLCQSCAVECKCNGGTEYKLCCKDGPVFDAKQVVF